MPIEREQPRVFVRDRLHRAHLFAGPRSAASDRDGVPRLKWAAFVCVRKMSSKKNRGEKSFGGEMNRGRHSTYPYSKCIDAMKSMTTDCDDAPKTPAPTKKLYIRACVFIPKPVQMSLSTNRAKNA